MDCCVSYLSCVFGLTFGCQAGPSAFLAFRKHFPEASGDILGKAYSRPIGTRLFNLELWYAFKIYRDAFLHQVLRV